MSGFVQGVPAGTGSGDVRRWRTLGPAFSAWEDQNNRDPLTGLTGWRVGSVPIV
jgi:hypothetical protein